MSDLLEYLQVIYTCFLANKFIFPFFFSVYDGVKLCYAMAMLLTYFLQFYVPVQIILPSLLTKYQKRHGSCFEYSFRTVLVLLTGEFVCLFVSIVFLK